LRIEGFVQTKVAEIEAKHMVLVES